MKKIIVLLTVVLLACMVACSKNEPLLSNGSTTSTAIAKTESTTENRIVSTTTEKAQTDIGGGEIVQEKYRQCYYNISYQLTLLVDKDELKTWEEETYAKNPNETNEMVVKLFVQRFNISKESFERANLELAKVLYDPNSPGVMMNPKDYVNQEMYEIYNADIIYTFDDEIINNYYLSGEYPYTYESDYEEAVARGEYISQTEEWVDIEAMEAEIIAKYGEAEIVTETNTAEQTEAVTVG